MDVTTQGSMTLICATKRDDVMRICASTFQINKQRHRAGMTNLTDYERDHYHITIMGSEAI